MYKFRVPPGFEEVFERLAKLPDPWDGEIYNHNEKNEELLEEMQNETSDF
jgi:hypothetical protein